MSNISPPAILPNAILVAGNCFYCSSSSKYSWYLLWENKGDMWIEIGHMFGDKWDISKVRNQPVKIPKASYDQIVGMRTNLQRVWSYAI